MSFFRFSAGISAFAAILFPLSETGLAQTLSGASIAVEADWSSGYMGLGGGLAWVVALRDAEQLTERSVAAMSATAQPLTVKPDIETSSVEKPPIETSSVERLPVERPSAERLGAAEKPGIETSSVETPAAAEHAVADAAADAPVAGKPAATARPPRHVRTARNARRPIDNWTPIAFVAQTLDHTGMNIANYGLRVGAR